MKLFKKAAALATALCMSLSGVGVSGVEALAGTSFTSIGGWYETAYATWSDTNAVGASVYYKTKGAADSEYVQLNSSSDAVNTSLSIYDGSSYDTAAGYKNCVVRQTDSSTARVDIMGIGWGSFDIKVVASDGTTTYEDTVDILQEDRSGYAHFGADENYIGAYNDDDTLKSNATVIYVTEDNKNDITWSPSSTSTTYTGIGNIAYNIYRDTDYPIAIRFLGEVDTTAWEATSYSSSTYYISETTGKKAGTYTDWKGNSSSYADTTNTGVAISNLNTKIYKPSGSTLSITYLDNSTAGTVNTSSSGNDTFLNMMDFKGGSSNSGNCLPRLTIEGVGSDTVAKNWGINITRGKGTEVKNIHFVSSPEDACSSDESYYVWVHRCTFDVGANHCDMTSEQDKHEGDGSTDFNESYNITCSYNVYNNCHKTSLNGGSDSTQQFNYTYHHNYFNSCNSRLPLTRFVNVHLYNNYTYGASTAVSARASAFVFSEYNTYDSTTNVFKTQDGSSSYGYGKIKSYNDTITNCTNAATGTSITTASSRTTAFTIGSGDTNQHTSNTYSDSYITDFDTNSTYFYYDSTNKVSDVSYLTSAAEAKTYVSAQSGVLKDSTSYTDIMNSSSSGDDDEEEDDGYTTIESDITLKYDNYTDSDIAKYFQYSDISYTAGNTYLRFTTSTTFSFKAAAGATITINAKNPSSSGDPRTITLTGKNTGAAYNSYDPSVDYTELAYVENSAEEDIYTLTADNNVNIGYISVTFSGSSSGGGDDDTTTTTTTEITTETTTEAGVIYDKAVLTFGDSETETITETTTCDENGYFTLLADSSNYMVIDSNNKTVNGNKYTKRLKSINATTYTDEAPASRAIVFKTGGSDGVIQICGAMANSNATSRNIYIYKDSDFTNKVCTITFTSGDPVMSEMYNLDGAGTYYITFDSGINMYQITVAVGREIQADTDGNGYIFTDGTDSYIVSGIEKSVDISAYSKLEVSVTIDNTLTADTDTVYEYAYIDDEDLVITPTHLNENYSYLYIVEIEGSGGSNDFSYTSALS